MHYRVVACEVMAREVYFAAARARNTVEVRLLTQGLHDNPDVCRARIQECLDAAGPDVCDAVLLCYGLCNNGLAGVRAAKVPVVLPRAHDCITLLMGDKARYAAEFAAHPGTYYFSSGWLEYGARRGERVGYAPKSGLAERMAYEDLVRRYGEENAAFIRDVMTGWQVRYTRGAYIRFPFADPLGHADAVRRRCAENGWEYAEIEGRLDLLQDLLDGRWDAERFLALAPGEEIVADLANAAEGIVRAGRPAAPVRQEVSRTGAASC